MKRKFAEVTLAHVQAARQELQKHLEPSPLLQNSWLSEALGCEVYLKLENMTPIGSFKIRGATYRISQLTPKERRRGVIAASAGNHAQGVAWGSARYGVNAQIVMPVNAPLTKIQNTRALGADVILDGDNYDQAYQAARKLATKSGRVFIHAFDDPHVIAGQGTAALELMEQLPDLDAVIGSIGGGGWMAGVGTVLREMRPEALIIGCQAAGAPSMVQALRKGRPVRLKNVDTFADGIAVIEANPRMRKLLSTRIDHVVEETDEAIATAVLTLLEKAKILVEGAGAVPLAALQTLHKKLRRKKVVLLISGGNIDVNVLGRIIDRGLIQAGRRVRINVVLHDRPGSLARLTQLIAQQGANVLQAIHDRNEPMTAIDETEIALTLETRGTEHSRELIRVLRENVLKLELVH